MCRGRQTGDHGSQPSHPKAGRMPAVIAKEQMNLTDVRFGNRVSERRRIASGDSRLGAQIGNTVHRPLEAQQRRLGSLQRRPHGVGELNVNLTPILRRDEFLADDAGRYQEKSDDQRRGGGTDDGLRMPKTPIQRVRCVPPPNARTIAGACHLECSDQIPASPGVTVKEMRSEVRVETVTTIPNSASSRPIGPCKNAIGRKTTTSTSVRTTVAVPISERALTAASSGGCRSVRQCRSAFSRTTVEPSMSMPKTNVIASSEIVSIVKPSRRITNKATASETGMEIMTTTALRHDCRKNSMTIAVSAIPSSRVLMTPQSCCSVTLA